MAKKKKIIFWAMKEVKEPVIVKFRRADGSIAKFKATKIIREPTKISFLAKKKKYKK